MAKKKGKIDQEVEKDVRKKLKEVNEELKKKGFNDVPSFIREDVSIPTFSTGLFSLNNALSGGFPQGRITVLYGPEKSGKSLISLIALAKAQQEGKKVMYIDVEWGFDGNWAEKLGVKVNDESFLLYQSEEASVIEKVFKVIETYARNKVVDIIVIDSAAFLIPEESLDNIFEQGRIGAIARSLTIALRAIVPVLAKNNVSLIIINQIRENLEAGFYGPKEDKMPGGRALLHAASTILKINKATNSKLLREKDKITGVEIMCQVQKHRGGPNFRKANFRIDYEKGLDKVYDVVVTLQEKGKIKQTGSWFELPELDLKVQGFESLTDKLREDNELLNKAAILIDSILKKEYGDENVLDNESKDKEDK